MAKFETTKKTLQLLGNPVVQGIVAILGLVLAAARAIAGI